MFLKTGKTINTSNITSTGLKQLFISMLLSAFIVGTLSVTSCNREDSIVGEMEVLIIPLGFSSGLTMRMENKNYILAKNIAYQLEVQKNAELHLGESGGRSAITVPSAAGRMVLMPGATYKAKGDLTGSEEKLGERRVKILKVTYLEYLKPAADSKKAGVTLGQ